MSNSQWRWKAAGLTAMAAIALAAAGCNSNSGGSSAGSSTASGGSAKTLQIAVIPKGTTHEYWESIHAGAIKAQEELDAAKTPINVIWQGTTNEGDRNGQVTLVQNFITKGVDGIVLAPLDQQALVGPVHDAVGQKIPVVIIDSSLNGTDWSSFVATDNEKGGEIAGENLGKLLNGKGNVIVLPYAQGSASTLDREKGFAEAIAKFPGIKVLSNNQYGGPTTDTAFKTAQNILARYGSQTQGVFASNETNTRGMLLALKDAKMVNKVQFVGFDTAKDLIADLKSNQIQGLVAQNPFKMGYIGVKTCVAVIKGQKVPKTVDTGVAYLTPQNVDSPAMQEYVSPPIAQYLNGTGSQGAAQ
jgi:ribose transport system substrate-binding protein